MNRRSFLSFLGLAPVAAPAAVAAASASSIQGRMGGSAFVIDMRAGGASTFTFDGQTLILPGVEIRNRVNADGALAERIDAVVAQAR